MNIIQAITALFPNAVSGTDYTVNLATTTITLWNNALGPQPTEAQLTAAWNTILLQQAQAAQIAAIQSAFQIATLETPIPYMGTTFWTDPNSQFLLLGAAWGYTQEGAVPAGFAFWDSTDKPVPMTLAQLQGLATAVLSMYNTNFAQQKNLITQINAATTVAAVQAVVWPPPETSPETSPAS